MRINKQKKAFTLPEVLVSIAVIVMVVMAATNLLVASIRANAVNISTLVAYGLAQEGIEAVRNIRDSDWLLGADFQGEVGRQNVAPWGDSFPSVVGDTRYYTVEFRDPLDLEVKNSMQLANAVPWTLKGLMTDKDYGSSSATRLFLKEFGSAKEKRYVHGSQSAESTPFHRYIEVIPLAYEMGEGRVTAKIMKYRVSSVVNWEEYGQEREVKLETELTDWKRS
jgi:prepilin-type N-terminal cleavage/methylation domain-containing protein